MNAEERLEAAAIILRDAVEELSRPAKTVHFAPKGSTLRRLVDGESAVAICGAQITDPQPADAAAILAPCEECHRIYASLEP